MCAYCNVLQHTATYCNTQQRTATHCNVLQHTATYCNTLQQCTATLHDVICATTAAAAAAEREAEMAGENFDEFAPSSRGSPFHIFISSGAPDVAAAQVSC